MFFNPFTIQNHIKPGGHIMYIENKPISLSALLISFVIIKTASLMLFQVACRHGELFPFIGIPEWGTISFTVWNGLSTYIPFGMLIGIYVRQSVLRRPVPNTTDKETAKALVKIAEIRSIGVSFLISYVCTFIAAIIVSALNIRIFHEGSELMSYLKYLYDERPLLSGVCTICLILGLNITYPRNTRAVSH